MVEAGVLRENHEIFGITGHVQPDGQAKLTVLVDHIQEHEPPAVVCGIEKKVYGPDVVQVFSVLKQR